LPIIAVCIAALAACNLNSGSNDGPTNLGDTLTVSGQQVWEPNDKTGYISKLFYKSNSDNAISAFAVIPKWADANQDAYAVNGEGNVDFDTPFVDSVTGSISKGILDLTIPAPDDSLLYLNGDDLLYYVFHDWWGDITQSKSSSISIDPEDVRGNRFIPMAAIDDPPGFSGLVQMAFNGTQSSLTCSYIYYFYVDKDCTITAKRVVDQIGYNSFNAFTLNLKEGWNTVLAKQTYTDSGHSTLSLEVRNPQDMKWALMPVTTSF